MAWSPDGKDAESIMFYSRNPPGMRQVLHDFIVHR